MKKNLLIVAMLAGAMTLPSCVDNNESPAVTAIRQAKVEQLQSIAAMNKATAEAALISANADAALKQAQAAYQNAQAAYEEARTETEKANAQIAVAKAQAEIQTIAANLEVSLAQAQLNLFKAQKEYENALKNDDKQQISELSDLFYTYQQKSTELLGIRQSLANSQIDLAKLQANLENDQEARANQIAELEKSINDAQLQIEADSTALLIYENYNTNTAEAQAELKKAEAALTEASQKKQTAYKAYTTASTEQTNANRAVINNIYREYATQIIPGIGTFENVAIQYYGKNYGPDNRLLPYSNTYSAVYTDEDGEQQFIPLYSTVVNGETQTIEYTYGPYNTRGEFSYNTYEKYYNLIEGGFDEYIDILTERVADNEGKALTDAQKAYTKSAKAQSDAQAKVDAQQKKVDEAEAAVKKAGDKATDAQKQAVTDAKAALEPLETALAAAKTQAESDLNAQNMAEDALDNINKQLDQIKSKIAIMTENAPAFQTLVNNCNEARVNSAEAYVAYRVADGNLDIANAEYYAINNVVNGVDNTSTINYLKQSIASAQQNIKNYKAQILDLENANGTEQAIEAIENTIANYEAQITVLEKQVEAAKAALDAAMASQE